MKPIVLFRKIHKWLGLLIGIQIFFWVIGGVVMSILPLDEVHGDHLYELPQKTAISPKLLSKIPSILNEHNIEPTHIAVETVFDLPLLKIKDSKQLAHVFNLQTGNRSQGINQHQVQAFAESIYRGTGTVASVESITEHSTEYRKKIPAWRVKFNDDENTSFYFDSLSGELQSVRNDQWRLFDFVWMLHIMDYDQRTDFNHPLLIGAALLALILVISGGYLVVKTFRKRDFGIKK